MLMNKVKISKFIVIVLSALGVGRSKIVSFDRIYSGLTIV
jgi:hypothetical protein